MGTMDNVLQESAESKKPRGHLDPVGFADHVAFHTYVPPQELRPFLEHFWTLSWHNLPTPYRSEQVMHRPFVDLFLSHNRSGVQGTFTGNRTYVASGTGKIIGARFLPGAFHLVWPGKMTALQNRHLSLKTVVPEIDENVILQLDDRAAIAALIPVLRAKLPAHNDAVACIQEIIQLAEESSTKNVGEIATAIGKSERWVQNLFQEYVGVSLQWLLLRNRLLATAQTIRNTDHPNWVAIAYDLGYSSQQHFITDFKKATGKTPLQYKHSMIPH